MNDHLILKSFVKQLYICSIMISLSACALGDDLTVRAAKDVGRESEAMQYIRSLQLLRYYINGEEHIEQMSFDDGCYPGQIPLAGCTSSSSDLHDAIASKCNIPCANTEDLPPQSSTACSMLTCQIEQVTCAVNEILDLATTLESVSYRPNEHTEIIVPPQDFVVRAALHEQAFGAVFYSALILSQWMGTQFNHSTMYDFINAEADCAMPRSEGAPTWFEAMSISGLELIQLALEAANKAADDYVALADGIRGRHPMLETGAKDNREVRAHAAHLLAGGGDMKALFDATFDPDSDFDLTTVLEFSDYELPICTSRPLGRQARTAMALIRESGIHPTHIDALDPDNPNYISIEEFLASDSGESIRNRIAALRKLPGEVSSFNASQFASYFGLTINDFVEARIYIADENRIFRRSYEIVVDDALPSEYVGDRMRYAATVNSPSQPHWSRYAAEYSNIGLDGILSNPNIDLSGMLPIISNELVTKPNVRVFYTSIFNILSKWASYGDSDAEEGSYERGLYELALRYRRHVFPEGTAAIVLAYDEAAQVSTYSMAAAVRQSGYKYATVSSSDALECATTARIEGVLCSRADMVLELGSESGPPEINISSLDSLADVSTEYDVQYFGTHVISDKRYIYFLRSKDPNGTHDGPGDWDVISVGKVFPIEVPDSKLVLRMHVEPMIFERMGTIMSPSTRWCAKPAVHCGEAFDSRIPLEDELTDDGSIAENSWRRQLALAREAADFADALGQEARNAAVSMEEIAQGALIELQDLCGSIVSLDPLQNCNDCGNGLTPEEILSRNLVDGTVPNLMRLERCIGNAGRLDFATLGDEPICAWTIGNDNTTLCQLVEGDQTLLECPRFRSADDTEGCRSPSEDPAYRVVEIGAEPRQLLKLFSRPANYVEAPAQHSCNEIRIMREKFIQREPFLGELLRIFQPRGKVNPLWLPDALNSITSAITWSAKPGNFSTIHSGGNVLATTGDFMSGWSTTGVCASSASERARYQCDGETFDNSLFCVDRDCSIEGCEECVNSRRNLNTRLARAALLARMLPSIDTLSPHTDFVLPTVANSSQASYTSRITTINHGVFGDVVDVGRYRKQTDDTEVVKPDVMFYEYPLGSNAYGDRRTVGFELAEAIKGQPFIYPDKSPPILSFLKRINNDAAGRPPPPRDAPGRVAQPRPLRL